MQQIRTLVGLLTLVFLVAPSTAARYPPNTSDAATHHELRSPLSSVNATRALSNDLEKRAGAKYIFMHHIVGINGVDSPILTLSRPSLDTFPYTQADWADDIRQIQAKGVDAVALNMGGDTWQRTQVASAYAAAAQLGTNFKLFLSFDFTAMGCDVNDLVGRVNDFANHPNQFRVDGKVMISSFSGDCLGNAGWASLKAQTNAYLMPFIWGLEGHFNEWPSLDTWYCWGCAWPTGNIDKNTDDDEYYMSQLGSRYGTTISPWMFTHYGYKNWYQRGDNWLLLTRWEQLMAMRDRLTFIELVSWILHNYNMGPIKGAQPDGTTWATGFPHTAWYDLSQYYITAFKTGSYPAITQDVIYYWARPHPAAATASSDALPKPDSWDWTPDTLWAVVFSTSTSTVTLTVGSSTQTFSNVAAGVTKLQIPLSPGKITVKMVKNGATTIQQTPSDYTYVTNPTLYNYNVYVGSAKA
ncbi:glycosyl hydrolase family 71-domain-containing protein [Lyophyllum atratum]|nr:glycosyl hydrolase family 71-domain-containing protein [Lyophyllum atratum]